MEESKDFVMAGFASGQGAFLDYYYGYVNNKIFNLQLRYWVEALEKFNNLTPELNLKKEELVIIINLLCQSLAILAGVNIRPKKNTPPLMVLFEKELSKEKKWNLISDNPILFNELKEMNTYYNNLSKHLNRSKYRKSLIREINSEKIKKYMYTTQNIWIWFLGKRYKGKIPEEQMIFFNNAF